MVPKASASQAPESGTPGSDAAQMRLPVDLTTLNVVAALANELQTLDNLLSQEAIRHPDLTPQTPILSRLLGESLELNKLDILLPSDRKMMRQFLEVLRSEAPTIHISFNADPSPLFLQRLVAWLRQQIHPLVLLRVGLYPGIGAGCIVRTTNKYLDFSIKQHFKAESELLLSSIRGNQTTPLAVQSNDAQERAK